MSPLAPTRIGPRTFAWGERTFVMGILNITPDSFSGDGLLQLGHAVESAMYAGRQMVAAGADLLDVGGESTRPGGTVLTVDEERERVVPVLRGLRAAFPDLPLSIDTIKPGIAEAALDAGADLLNDVWGVRDDPAMLRVAAARGVPIVLMHNRSQPVYRDVVAEVVDDLGRALDRARAPRGSGRPSSRTRSRGRRSRDRRGCPPLAPGRAPAPGRPRPPRPRSDRPAATGCA